MMARTWLRRGLRFGVTVCRSNSKLAACLLAAIARLRYPFLGKVTHAHAKTVSLNDYYCLSYSDNDTV